MHTMTSLLEKQVCCTNTCGDLFKLIVPVGWSITAFAATLAYLLAPLRRNEDPRWGTGALVSVSAFAGVGASIAIYNFHRTASYILSNESSVAEERKSKLRNHTIGSAVFSVLCVALTLFFAFIAPSLDLCSHETCGADISWSVIGLGTSLVWVLAVFFEKRKNRNQMAHATDNGPITGISMEDI